MSSPNPAAAIQQSIVEETAKFHTLREDIAKLRNNVQLLAAQQNENEMVKQELSLLKDETPVYKMVGPVLLKQELDEAKSTVEKRLEFIGGERKKVEETLSAKEIKANEIAAAVQQMNGALQQAAVEATRAIAAEAQAQTRS
jgi:prefoldin beta subunit